MSADNFMAILKEGDKFIGYHCSASVANECPLWRKCYPCIGCKHFAVGSVEEAIEKCESFSYLEYGYRFVDYHATRGPEEGFCEICAHNPDLPKEGSKKAKARGCNCKRVNLGGREYGF